METKTSNNHVHHGDILVNPLTYYQKPAIGQDQTEDLSPVQIIFPNGGFGIGIAMKNPDTEINGNHDGITVGVLASAPTTTELDRKERRGLLIGFLIIGVVNIVLTSLMFGYADIAESSAVEPSTGFLPTSLERISSSRRSSEVINFAFTIIIMCLGMISAITDSALGLTGYCFGIILNFFLATPAVPAFVYSFRYILDVGMLYIGLILRSRLLYTFLPINLHRN